MRPRAPPSRGSRTSRGKRCKRAGRRRSHVWRAAASPTRGFADPSHEISLQWLDTRKRLKAAQKRWHDSEALPRVLLICGSARNDGTCPGEVSKTWSLIEIARRGVQGLGAEADLLDSDS